MQGDQGWLHEHEAWAPALSTHKGPTLGLMLSCRRLTILNNFFKIIIYLFIYLFIYFWLCWVFVSVRGLPLVAASGGHSSSRCTGLSLSWPLSCCGTQAPDVQAQ